MGNESRPNKKLPEKWGQKHPLFGEGIVILKKKRIKEKKKKFEKKGNWRTRVDGNGA